MNEPDIAWMLLIVSLPTANATARMRLWRAFKALGCQALRDGAYLLPGNDERELTLQALADECASEGGTAWLMQVQPRSLEETEVYRQLFDRSDDYDELRKTWKATNRTLASLSPQELVRLQRRLQREYDAVRATDFFAGESSVESEAALRELNKRIAQLLSPDEPHETHGQPPRLDATEYRGRTWATRRRLWVDRVASA